MLGVEVAVNAKVATLASGDYVCGVHADGVAPAEVRYGEDDLSLGEVRGLVVGFGAAAEDGSVSVEPALSGALAAALGAFESNEMRKS